MHIIKECIIGFSVAFMLQKDSLYTNKISRIIQKLKVIKVIVFKLFVQLKMEIARYSLKEQFHKKSG